MVKQVIALIFGGQSSEHEVSCMSAVNVIKYIDQSKYDLLLIGITKEGKWLKVDDIKDIESGNWREGKISAYLLPDAVEKSIIVTEGAEFTKIKIFAVFPVLHGLYGEDGTIQGLCELAGINYVGCNVMSSAAAMDKAFTKLLVDELGIKQADYELVYRHELKLDMGSVLSRIESRFKYPVFIKPANSGSSKGVNMADNISELRFALEDAALLDRKMLVEESIVGRELECAVLGSKREPMISGVGEILSAGAFYDFESKYYNSDSKTIINPVLDEEIVKQIQSYSKKIFRKIECHGIARVDFFLNHKNEVIFNEINTMPGFSNISMYPMLWEAYGIDRKELVQRLIDFAGERE